MQVDEITIGSEGKLPFSNMHIVGLTGKFFHAKEKDADTGCSLKLCKDMELELSEMFGNCLIKCLPKDKKMDVLEPVKAER